MADVDDRLDEDDGVEDDGGALVDGAGEVEFGDEVPAGDKQAELIQKLAQFDDKWITGLYFIDIRREFPIEYNGARCSGHLGRVHRPIDVEWLRKVCGGGTYTITVRGPGRTHPKRTVYLATVSEIVVGGAPIAAPTIKDTISASASEEEKLVRSDGSPIPQLPTGVMADAEKSSVDSLLISNLIRQNNSLNERFQRLLEQRNSGEDVQAMLASQRESAQQMMAVMSEALRRDDGRSSRSVEEAIRELNERHARELDAVRREQSEVRQQALREAEKHEASIQAQHESQLEIVRQSYEARIRTLEESGGRLSDDLKLAREAEQRLRDQLADVRHELVEARIAANAAAAPREDPLATFSKTVEQAKLVTGLLQPAPPATTTSDRLFSLVESGAAEKLIGAAVDRVQQLRGRDQAPPISPQQAASNAQAWERYRQQRELQAATTGRQLPAARRPAPQRQKPPTSIGPQTPQIVQQPELAASPPATPAPSAAVPVPGVDAESMARVAAMLEQAAAAGTTPQDVAQGFVAEVGEDVAGLVSMAPPDAIITTIEATGSKLSLGARSLLRQALDALK